MWRWRWNAHRLINPDTPSNVHSCTKARHRQCSRTLRRELNDRLPDAIQRWRHHCCAPAADERVFVWSTTHNSILYEYVDVLTPFRVELFNRSLLQGAVPTIIKSAYITPLFKKHDVDSAENKLYRPISDLSVHLLCWRDLLRTNYSTISIRCRPNARPAVCIRVNHSTETALLNVLADILRAVDSKDLAVLALLDLSAAFDTVDHETLLHYMKNCMVLEAVCTTGFSCTSVVNLSPFGGLRRPSGIGSWADSIFSVHRRSALTGSCTLPTHRYIAFVRLATVPSSKVVFLTA